MPIFTFIKLCDPGALHKLLAQNGFLVSGISYDSGTNTTSVILGDGEVKDPTSVVNSYVYSAPVVYDYPQLYKNAQATVTSAITQYNTAVTNYTTALGNWNRAGGTVTTGNAVAKLTAAEQQITACASAIQAAASAINALVGVVTVLAQHDSIIEEE